MLLDIRPDHLQIVQAILQKHIPEHEVWAFGSRAKWTAKDYSDLDLCVITKEPLSFKVMGAIAEDFSESDLPWKVDVVDWSTTNESFQRIIEKDKVVVQKGLKGRHMGSEWQSVGRVSDSACAPEGITRQAVAESEADVGLRSTNPTYESDWHIVRLGDCCVKIGSGATPKGGKDSYFEFGPFSLIRSQNVYNEGFAANGLAFISAEQARRLDGVAIEEGDILLNITGDSVARVCIAPKKYLPARVNQHVAIIRPNSAKFDSRFVRYFLASPNQQNLMLGFSAVGATRNALTKGMIEDFKVPCPPLNLQYEIANILSSLDDRIALLRETNATLEAIAQALFKSWFVDFDPVHAKQQGREPEGIDADTAALFPDSFEESELGSIPKGWLIGSLADLAKLNPESWKANNHPDTVAYIDLANAKNNEIAVITDYLFDEAPSRARRVLRNGDTIVGTVRPGNRSFAFIHEAASNLTASTGFAVLRPKVSQNTEYVYLASTQDSSIEHLAHTADGGAYPAVRPEIVSGIQCVLPRNEVMQAFHNITSALLTRIVQNQHQAQTLTTLRDTLLPRLISGQLRLPDTEAMLEETT